MANIKDFIKKIDNSSVSLEEQQQALAQVEKTIMQAKAKREESIGKNVDLVISALKTIESKLEAKLDELNNTPAKQGVQGPVGKAGNDGQNGVNGRDGVSGKDGVDGKDGVNGQDGVSVIDAKIDFDGSLVVYLSNGNEIDCGQILSLDVAKNIIINSGVSGTSQAVIDTIASLQEQINTLTGIDGTLGTMAQQAADAVAITGGTITGTRINPRVTNITSSSTITPPSNTADQFSVTALAVPATIAIPSGTPVAGQKLTIRIKDDGTARALTWTTSAGGYRVIGSTLPTTTVINKTVYVGCIYNSTDSFWDVVAVAQQV